MYFNFNFFSRCCAPVIWKYLFQPSLLCPFGHQFLCTILNRAVQFDTCLLQFRNFKKALFCCGPSNALKKEGSRFPCPAAATALEAPPPPHSQQPFTDTHGHPMPRKHSYSQDLKWAVIHQAYTLGSSSTAIAFSLDLPLQVVQRVQKLWVWIWQPCTLPLPWAWWL